MPHLVKLVAFHNGLHLLDLVTGAKFRCYFYLHAHVSPGSELNREGRDCSYLSAEILSFVLFFIAKLAFYGTLDIRILSLGTEQDRW